MSKLLPSKSLLLKKSVQFAKSRSVVIFITELEREQKSCFWRGRVAQEPRSLALIVPWSEL